jgi:hypothetical protein
VKDTKWWVPAPAIAVHVVCQASPSAMCSCVFSLLVSTWS